MPFVLRLDSPRQEDCYEFKARIYQISLDYIAILCFKKQTKNSSVSIVILILGSWRQEESLPLSLLFFERVMFMHVLPVHIHVYAMCGPGGMQNKKAVLNALELELKSIVSHLVGAEN